MDIFKNIILFLSVYVGVTSNVDAMRHRRPQMEQIPIRQIRDQTPSLRNFFNHNNLAEADNCIHNICSNITNYPSISIRNVISKQKEFHNFFGPVIQPYHRPTLSGKAPTIAEEFEEKNMCATRQFTSFPQTALNKFRKRIVIVNVDDFRQAVTFEICVKNAKCFLADHKPVGYETSCKQQYSLIRLVSIAEDFNIKLDNVPIPSSCVCTYKRTVGYK